MSRILPRSVVRFLKNDAGVTGVECALLLAVVVAICLVALVPGAARSADNAPAPTIVLETEAN
jgi:Flp pilus assembly pilin Flp